MPSTVIAVSAVAFAVKVKSGRLEALQVLNCCVNAAYQPHALIVPVIRSGGTGSL